MGPGLTIRTATLGWSPLCLLPNSTRGQGSSPLSWRGMWLSTKIPYPFGIEDWQRIFGGFTFLRNFSYTPLWFIGKNRKYSIRLYSFGLISQERKQEVWSLGKKILAGSYLLVCVWLALSHLCLLAGKVAMQAKVVQIQSWEHQSSIFRIVLPKAISSRFLYFPFL
jgi:hypothetical protein